MVDREEWLDDVRRWCFDSSRAMAAVGCDVALAGDRADTGAALVALPSGFSQVVATFSRDHDARIGPSRSTA